MSMDDNIEKDIPSILPCETFEGCEFKHERVGVLEDGRVKVKITCDNEWLEQPVSVITNDDRIGITPFGKGHVAKVIAHKKNGDLVELYGYFPEEGVRDRDELLYFAGICKTLSSGATSEVFGKYFS